jgi:MFS family permease
MTRDHRPTSERQRLGGRFYTLWTGQAISQFGDYVAFLTVPLFVAELSSRALDFGLVYAAETVPALLFGVFGGVLLDRFPLRPILIGTDLARAAGFIVLGFVAVGADPQVWMIVLLAFLVGTFAAAFASGLRSFLPILLPAHHLATANARLVLSQQVVFLLGPVTGAFVVAVLGFSASYFLNSLTFVVSAITLVALGQVPRRRFSRSSGYLNEVVEGFRYLFGEVRLRLVTLVGGLINFTVAFFEALLVLIGLRLFGLDSPAEFGVLFLAFGVGAILGALAAPKLSDRFGLGKSLVLGVMLYGIGFLLLTFVTGSVRTYPLLVLVGVGPPIANVAVTTVRQLYTPDELLGRVTAASRAIVWGTLPLGALIGGLLADEFRLVTVARILPLTLIAAAVWLRFTPIWTAQAPAGR